MDFKRSSFELVIYFLGNRIELNYRMTLRIRYISYLSFSFNWQCGVYLLGIFPFLLFVHLVTFDF